MKRFNYLIYSILSLILLTLFGFSSCEKEGMSTDGGYDIHKCGNFVAMSTNNGCILYDVAIPASAKILSRVNVGYSQGVFIKDNSLFISTDGFLYAYNLSTPSSPVKLGSIASSIATIFVKDTLAFLKNGSGVKIINIKDPANMTKVGEYRFVTIATGEGIYATDHMIYTADGNLKQLSYTNNGEISLIQSYSIPAFTISSDGSYLYIGTYKDGAVIASIADENNVYQVGSVTFSKTWGITHSAGFLYVASSFGALTKVDISDVYNPKVVDKTSDKYAAHGVFYDNGYLFVAGTEESMFILDAEDLSVVYNK